MSACVRMGRNYCQSVSKQWGILCSFQLVHNSNFLRSMPLETLLGEDIVFQRHSRRLCKNLTVLLADHSTSYYTRSRTCHPDHLHLDQSPTSLISSFTRVSPVYHRLRIKNRNFTRPTIRVETTVRFGVAKKSMSASDHRTLSHSARDHGTQAHDSQSISQMGAARNIGFYPYHSITFRQPLEWPMIRHDKRYKSLV